MSNTYRIGPARIMVAPTIDSPLTDWVDFGYFRGDTAIDIRPSVVARGMTDQTGPVGLVGTLAIAPREITVRVPLSDHDALKVVEAFPGSVRVTSGAKEALTFPSSPIAHSVKAVAVVPELDLTDPDNPNPWDSEHTVYFEYAILSIEEVGLGAEVDDDDDALASTTLQLVVRRAIGSGEVGIGYPYLNANLTNPFGVLFAWQPSLDALTPIVGEGVGTFTRNSIATYVNASGVITQVSANEARYQDGGLLLEPQRTNRLPYSQEFDDASWGKAGTTTISANAAVSPTGTADADLIKDGAATSAVYRSSSWSAGSSQSLSAFVKQGTASTVKISGVDKSGPYTGITVTFTFATESIAITTPHPNGSGTCGVDIMEGGWYRLWVSWTIDAATNYSYVELGFMSGNGYLWGTQIEEGSYPTSYIPTAGAAVTRNADALTIPFTEGLPAEGMTVLWKGVFKSTPTNNIGALSIGDNAATAAGEFRLRFHSGGGVYFHPQSGGSTETATGGPVFTKDVEDDIIGQIDAASDTIRTFNASDVAQATTAITSTAGHVPADNEMERDSTALPFELAAILVVKGLLTPAQMRTFLRSA